MRDAAGGGVAPRLALLLTSAIVPHEAVATLDRRPETRASAYRSGIAAWSFFGDMGSIVVAEASGVGEATFRRLTGLDTAEHPFEFIESSTDDSVAARGKGAAEVDLIAHALRESATLADAGRIVKVTGRYVARNAASLIRAINDADRVPEIAVNLHSGLSYADSRVFVFSSRFFSDYLYPMRDRIDDANGVWLEHVLAQATLRAAADGLDWGVLPIPPRLSGTAGTTGLALRESAPAYAVRRLKHALKVRVLSPRREQR